MPFDFYVNPDTNDIEFTNGDIRKTKNNRELIRQRLGVTLKTFIGEWFTDVTFGGIDKDFLFNKGASRQDLDAWFTSVILSVEGVISIARFESEYNPLDRSYSLIFSVNTEQEEVGFSISAGNSAAKEVRYQDWPCYYSGWSIDWDENYGGICREITDTEDRVPDQFTFVDQADVNLSTSLESNEITLTGMTDKAVASVSGGEMSINGGDWQTVANYVNNGDVIKLRHTSAGSLDTATNTTLDVGGITDTFTSTTTAQPANVTQMFASTDSGTLHYIDISDPASPTIENTVAVDNIFSTAELHVKDNYLFYVVMQESFPDTTVLVSSFDISDPMNIQQLDSLTGNDIGDGLNAAGRSKSILHDDVLYIPANNGNSLTSIDVSDPSAMSVVGTEASSYTGGGTDGLVKDNRLILFGYELDSAVDSAHRLYSIDISDPSILSSFNTSTGTAQGSGAARIGDYAYEARSNNDRYQVYDISDAANPSYLGDSSGNDLSGGDGLDVATDGTYLYMITSNDQFKVSQVTDPANAVIDDIGVLSGLTKLGEFGVSGRSFNVVVFGDYAYISAGDTLYIVDITDKANPALESTLANAQLDELRAIEVTF